MSLIRKEEQSVRLLRSYEPVDEASSVPEMHVLVNQTVHEQEIALYALNMCHHRALLVAVGVALRSAHVPLRVTGVISVPISDWGSRDGTLEHLWSLGQAHCAEVASVAPPFDSNPLAVRQALIYAPLDSSHLIIYFKGAHPVLQDSLEVKASASATTVVNLQDEVAFFSELLGIQVSGHSCPSIHDILHMWTTIARYDSRVRSRSMNTRIWLVQCCLQCHRSVR
mmetsp:Transcript_53262/g.98465  ORF Transcript_53262/g.98465 Transcript_53262/m.98465 type:complete len:225 (+) Transcript_53262:210-884(+)